jgi:hypothetical protein
MPGPADGLLYVKTWLFTVRRNITFLKSIIFSAGEVTCFLQVKVNVKFALGQATKNQRGSRGIALLFL